MVWDDFKKSYKEANSDSKGVKTVAKEGGEKWKSMTDEENKLYVDKAAELKQEYKRALESDIAGDGDTNCPQKFDLLAPFVLHTEGPETIVAFYL